MAGLLIRELKLRGLVERLLVVCPANLAFQWQRELKGKFDETFLVLKGSDIRDQFGVNQWLEHKQAITSLDLAKRDEILPGLRQVHWDLAIVDEAHRMSWTPPARKTARYALGEIVRDTTDHLLLLTATPHKGDPTNFSLFLQLLDRDAYADVCSFRVAIDRGQAPFYLRRTKEAMVYFPERLLEAITLAGNAEQVHEEIAELRQLAPQAHAIEETSTEAKLARLKDLLHTEGFFDDPEQRLLLFTEFKDTLDYLVDCLQAWGFRVGTIHGGMRPDSRDDPGTRLSTEQQFKDGAIQILVATEAAGEGINLQCCHILFNYDIPSLAQEVFATGACFSSLQHQTSTRLDFYRARVVDGLGHVVHERLYALELMTDGDVRLQEPSLLGNCTPTTALTELPSVATLPEATAWLHTHALTPFLEEVQTERQAEIDRIASHVELSLTELLQKADEEIGRAAAEIDQSVPGAEGHLAQAEARHTELLHRRERRRQELQHQRAVSLQGVEWIASALILPHPERETPEVRRLRPNAETEATAMRVVMEHERVQGREVYDVHEKNLGYDITSLDLNSGELRLIEVKGIGAATGSILLTPNERRVAEDRCDCYWLYVVTNCNATPQLQAPIKDPARFPWHEVTQVQHYWLEVDTLTQPMQVREEAPDYRR
jgi:hypothetical protein